MKIKNRKSIQSVVRSAIGTTCELDIIEFYDDGTWDVMSSSSYSGNCIGRYSLRRLASKPTYECTVKHAVSSNLDWIELGKNLDEI